MTVRDEILADPKQGRSLRAAAVVGQFASAASGKNSVHYGGVEFWSVTNIGDGGIEVRTSPNRVESVYRIFNPPTLVRDGSGLIVVDGRRYREDPLGAVAEVILMHRSRNSR